MSHFKKFVEFNVHKASITGWEKQHKDLDEFGTQTASNMPSTLWSTVKKQTANCKLQVMQNLVRPTEERRQRTTIISSVPQRTGPGHTLTEGSTCISSFQFKQDNPPLSISGKRASTVP